MNRLETLKALKEGKVVRHYDNPTTSTTIKLIEDKFAIVNSSILFGDDIGTMNADFAGKINDGYFEIVEEVEQQTLDNFDKLNDPDSYQGADFEAYKLAGLGANAAIVAEIAKLQEEA